MKKKVENLSIRAIKGEPEMVNTLFGIAKDCEKNGQYENAAIAYREMAFASRILASRSCDEKMQVENKLERVTIARDVYAWWVEDHPDGMVTLPYPSCGIDEEFIRVIVINEMLFEEKFIPVFWYLEEVLTDLGMKFSSPGGSVQRRICGFLGFLFGLQKSSPHYTKFLEFTAVRVGLDLIADEIVRRHAAKKKQ